MSGPRLDVCGLRLVLRPEFGGRSFYCSGSRFISVSTARSIAIPALLQRIVQFRVVVVQLVLQLSFRLGLLLVASIRQPLQRTGTRRAAVAKLRRCRVRSLSRVGMV